MEIRLQNLTLTNFKGIKKLSLDLNSVNANIYGDNETGKTTIADAFYWLLFSKDSDGNSNFTIKTIGTSGLDYAVEATMLIDGKTITLKKTLNEKWTKKRGSDGSVMEGHTTTYEKDGVPLSGETEFKTIIASIIPEDKFRLLTDPFYFAKSLHWTKRREILLAISGDVTVEEVISANSTVLSELPAFLEGRSIDDYQKIATASRKKINAELTEIPARIDQVTIEMDKILQEVPDPETLKKQNSDLNYQISQLEYELGTIKNGNALGALHNKILNAEASMAEQRTHYYSHQHTDPNSSRRDELQYQIANQSQLQQTQKIRLENQKLELANMEERITALRIEVGEMREQTWTGDLICGYCKAPFTEEKLEEMRQKFNAQKAQQIDAKVAAGKSLRADIEAKKLSIDTLLTSIDLIAETIHKYKEELEQIKPESEAPPPFESSQAYPGLAQSIADSKKAYEELKSSTEPRESEINGILAVKRHELELNSARLVKYKSIVGMNESVTSLKARERELAKEIERIDKGLFLVGEFIKAKVRMTDEKVAGMFKLAKFRMFEKNLGDDGIKEMCEVVYKDVPYSTDLNNAMRINVGLDIINTLSRYYGMSASIFIDNAESVVKLEPVEAQVIRLIVSAEDKKLRVETVV